MNTLPTPDATDPDPDQARGLHEKYLVERVDLDPTGKHADCRYFVLDPEHDAAALHALGEYAAEVRALGYEVLADDLDKWVDEIMERNPEDYPPTEG